MDNFLAIKILWIIYYPSTIMFRRRCISYKRWSHRLPGRKKRKRKKEKDDRIFFCSDILSSWLAPAECFEQKDRQERDQLDMETPRGSTGLEEHQRRLKLHEFGLTRLSGAIDRAGVLDDGPINWEAKLCSCSATTTCHRETTVYITIRSGKSKACHCPAPRR